MKSQHKTVILLGITTIAIVALFFVKRIAQDVTYHAFADGRFFALIPNAMNVLSNGLMFIVGCIGIYNIYTNKLRLGFSQANLLFFVAIVCTSIGSAYYHYNPNNNSLVWDRLPMTIAFMSFFTIVIFQFISKQVALKLLLPSVLIGISSILYWQITRRLGFEDLRFYVLVQFLPLILIVIITVLYPDNVFKRTTWLILGCYIIAKLCEQFDTPIFKLIAFSGHSLKHLFAGIAPLIYLYYLRNEKKQKIMLGLIN